MGQSLCEVLNITLLQVWGAIKLLLLVTVNSEKLKQNVRAHLEGLAGQFEVMQVIAEVEPTASIIESVTSLYADFMAFLLEALKYYREPTLSERKWVTLTLVWPLTRKAERMAKDVMAPWETRFQALVDGITQKIREVSGVTSS